LPEGIWRVPQVSIISFYVHDTGSSHLARKYVAVDLPTIRVRDLTERSWREPEIAIHSEHKDSLGVQQAEAAAKRQDLARYDVHTPSGPVLHM
jgi:hypothetical protein